MVVGFIFKIDQPLFFMSVFIHRHDDGAGIDLIGFFLVLQFAFRFQFLRCQSPEVHQADVFITPVPVDCLAVRQIFLKCRLDAVLIGAFPERDICQFRGKCRMPAVIRPVRIQNADLRHRGIAVLFFRKIVPDAFKILKGHGQIQGIEELLQRAVFHRGQAVKNLHVIRLRIGLRQRLRFGFIRDQGIHRIDAVADDALHLLVRYRARHDIRHRAPYHRMFLFIEKTDALLRRIRSLVKLPRQILYGKYMRALRIRDLFFIDPVYRRFREHRVKRSLIRLLTDLFHVVTDQHAHLLRRSDSKVMADLVAELPGTNRILRFLLYINSFDHTLSSSQTSVFLNFIRTYLYCSCDIIHLLHRLRKAVQNPPSGRARPFGTG